MIKKKNLSVQSLILKSIEQKSKIIYLTDSDDFEAIAALKQFIIDHNSCRIYLYYQLGLLLLFICIIFFMLDFIFLIFEKYGDISQWVIQKFYQYCTCDEDKQALENTNIINDRITINLIFKFCFFFYFIRLSSDNINFLSFDYLMQLLVWLIQIIYLFLIEMKYIINGENDLKYRFTWFKLIDLIQGILIQFQFSMDLFYFEDKSIFRIVVYSILSIDFCLNLCEFFKIKDRRYRSRPGDFKDQKEQIGGNYILYSCAFAAEFLSFTFISEIESLRKQGYSTAFPFNETFIQACYIGTITMIAYTGLELLESLCMALLCCSVCCATSSKFFLMVMHGANFGIGSFFLSSIAPLFCLVLFFRKLRCQCKRTKSYGRVILPTSEY